MALPSQARSRESLDRMLSALEALLSERSFDKITIADLADRAEVSVGSIYARFADKQALLIGMHRLIHERSGACRQRLINPKIWEARTLDEVIAGAIRAGIRYYRRHGKILRAVSLNAPPEVVMMVAAEIRDFNVGMTLVIASKSKPSDPRDVFVAVESIVRVGVALFNSRLSQTETGLVSPVSDRRLTQDLTTIAHAFLRPILSEESS